MRTWPSWSLAAIASCPAGLAPAPGVRRAGAGVGVVLEAAAPTGLVVSAALSSVGPQAVAVRTTAIAAAARVVPRLKPILISPTCGVLSRPLTEVASTVLRTRRDGRDLFTAAGVGVSLTPCRTRCAAEPWPQRGREPGAAVVGVQPVRQVLGTEQVPAREHGEPVVPGGDPVPGGALHRVAQGAEGGAEPVRGALGVGPQDGGDQQERGPRVALPDEFEERRAWSRTAGAPKRAPGTSSWCRRRA